MISQGGGTTSYGPQDDIMMISSCLPHDFGAGAPNIIYDVILAPDDMIYDVGRGHMMLGLAPQISYMMSYDIMMISYDTPYDIGACRNHIV